MNDRPPHGSGGPRHDRAAVVVERERELSAFTALLRDTRAGDTGMVLLEGPAGIGKSLLLRRLASEAERQGLRVVKAGCDMLERDSPFGVVRHLFSPLLASFDEARREQLLSGEAEGAARALSPEAAAGAVAMPPEDVCYSVLHGLYWFTCALAEQSPLVVIVDDAHRADMASLRFLVHLARRIDRVPLLLAMSRRSGAPATDEALLEEVAARPGCRVLRPRPLTAEGIATMVERTLRHRADDDFHAACLAATGGNPLLVHALLTVITLHSERPTTDSLEYATAQGSAFFQEAVLCVLRRQPESTLDAVRAMAVMGNNAQPEVCARLAGLTEPALLASMRTLAANGLLTAAEDGSRWSFNHGLVREVIMTRMPREERVAAHRRAARLLLDVGAPAEQVAGHLLQTGLPATEGWEVTVLLEAARGASSRGAPALAVDLLRPCLREKTESADDVAVLVELGFAETAVDPAASAEHLRMALDHVSEPQQRFHVLAALANSLVLSDRPREAVMMLAEQSATVDDPTGDLARCLEAHRLMASMQQLRGFRITLSEYPFDLDLPGDMPGERALLATRAGISVAHEETAGAAVAAARRVLKRGVPGADTPFFQTIAASVLLFGGLPDEADAAYQSILNTAWHRRNPLPISLTTAFHAEAAYRLGDITEALSSAQSALCLVPQGQWGTWLPLPVSTWIHALLESGDMKGAESVAAREWPPTARQSWQHTLFLCARGRLRLELGQPRAALADLLECGELRRQWTQTSPAGSSWWEWAARAHCLLGAPERARELAEDAVERSRRGGLRDALATGLRVWAETEDGPRRLALLEEALSVLADSPALLERTRVLIGLGSALHARGRTAAGRDTLRRALDLAHAAGAHPLRARAHEALLATGARPRRASFQGLDSLTPSERQVAELAAQGGTNREIAEALFVTQRTVELHLTSVYRKLGVTGRRELGGFFDSGGAGPVPRPRSGGDRAVWDRTAMLWP